MRTSLTLFYHIKNHSGNIFNMKSTVKHYSPGNIEWKNSVYLYNKNSTRDVTHKDELVSSIIRSYLYSIPYSLENNRSKRMRSLVRRTSTKKIFSSKPEIKQTQDKSIITLYLFDRENQVLKHRMFFLDKVLKKNNSLFLKNQKSKYDKSKLKLYMNTLHKSYRITNKHYKLNYTMMAKHMIPTFLRKRNTLRELFVFMFLRWVLTSNFHVKVNIDKVCEKCSNKNDPELNSKCVYCSSALKKNSSLYVTLSRENIVIYSIKLEYNVLNNINVLLFNYIYTYMGKIFNNQIIPSKIENLFVKYTNARYESFIEIFFKKEFDILKFIVKMQFNKFKLTQLTPTIKTFIANVYNKSVELNLINLKYLHLNSDMFMESIAIKLKRKKSSLLVLENGLTLMKRPKDFSGILNKDPGNNSPIKDSNINNILNNIKYKWITGMAIEARGRLTKRFTASRALFKYISKGSLRNLDNLYSSEFKYNSPSVYLLRNQFKPNLQHTYAYSNKRVGTFGLKGWINSV